MPIKLWIFYGNVTRVIDADTVEINLDLGFNIFHRVVFRIGKIDAPELRGDEKEAGHIARHFAKVILLNKRVKTTTYKRGKYRWICDIELPSGNDYATMLVKAGHAKYKDYE